MKIYKDCFTMKGWKVLEVLSPVIMEQGAILAGGTALALQIGHRISIDLDFFTNKKFSNDKIIAAINKSKLKFSLMQEEEGTLSLNIDGVKVSLFYYEYPFVDQLVDCEKIKIAGIKDIAVMKTIAICQRGTKRDFVDLYFILQQIPFHVVAQHLIVRYGEDRVNPINIGKAFVYFQDADANPDPRYSKEKSVLWKDIKTFFKKHTKQFVMDIAQAVK